MATTAFARPTVVSLVLVSAAVLTSCSGLSREESAFLRRFVTIERGMSASEAMRIIGRRGEVVERASAKFECTREGSAVRQIDYSFTTYHTAHSGSRTVYHVCLDSDDPVIATPMTLIDFD